MKLSLKTIFKSFLLENEKGFVDNKDLKLISSSKNIELLKKLAKHKNPSVRAMVASNPLTPVDILIDLFKTNQEPDDVDGFVLGNPSVPEDFLKHVIESGTKLQQSEALYHLKRRGVSRF